MVFSDQHLTQVVAKRLQHSKVEKDVIVTEGWTSTFSMFQLPSLVLTGGGCDARGYGAPVREPVYLTSMKMGLTFKSAKVG